MTTVTMETVHPAKYAVALDIAKKFISKSDIRLILKMVQHEKGGDLIATDSHSLIRIKAAHGFEESLLVNPKSFEIAKGNYPDTKQLIPEKYKSSIRLSSEQIKLWSEMHKAICKMKFSKRETGILKMKLEKESVSFEINNKGVLFQLPYKEYVHDEEIPHVLYSMELMKNALEAHELMKSEEIIISFSSVMRPILLDNQSDVQVIVLPIRQY